MIRRMISLWAPVLALVGFLRAFSPSAAPASREEVAKTIRLIQRADYEGDRAALRRLYKELAPFGTDKQLLSRIQYWRGFALWRRAINGFNEDVDPKELEQDLGQAIADFKESLTADPTFLDSRIGEVSSLGNLMYLSRGYPDRVNELLAQSRVLVKEANAVDPQHPRLLWVMGPIYWNIPVERGGGQDKAIAAYQTGLEEIRKRNIAAPVDPLDPTWGEPELLMSLAWSNLNREKPDLDAAEQQAQAALKTVPYWHYVRDILLPQIQKARSAPKT